MAFPIEIAAGRKWAAAAAAATPRRSVKRATVSTGGTRVPFVRRYGDEIRIPRGFARRCSGRDRRRILLYTPYTHTRIYNYRSKAASRSAASGMGAELISNASVGRRVRPRRRLFVVVVGVAGRRCGGVTVRAGQKSGRRPKATGGLCTPTYIKRREAMRRCSRSRKTAAAEVFRN